MHMVLIKNIKNLVLSAVPGPVIRCCGIRAFSSDLVVHNRFLPDFILRVSLSSAVSRYPSYFWTGTYIIIQIAVIIPSIPLFPNPPGTTIPSYPFNFSSTLSLFNFSESIKSTFTFTLFA